MKLAILFFALAQLADIVTTKRALARLGAREANPVMRALFDRFGLHMGLLIKATAAVAIHNHRLARKG